MTALGDGTAALHLSVGRCFPVGGSFLAANHRVFLSSGGTESQWLNSPGWLLGVRVYASLMPHDLTG